MVGRGAVLDLADPGEMSSTHGGNPVCAAAALACLDVLEQEELVAASATVGERVLEQFQALAEEFPQRIWSAHGRGLFISVNFVRPGSDDPDVEFVHALISEVVRRGVLMFTTGRGYMPSNIGEVPLIQPIWAGPAPSIYQAVENPQIADLIAWKPSDPDLWSYRVGSPGAVLGAENLENAHLEDWPISLATTPLAWLQGDCRGAVLLEHCEACWTNGRLAENEAALRAWWGEAA